MADLVKQPLDCRRSGCFHLLNKQLDLMMVPKIENGLADHFKLVITESFEQLPMISLNTFPKHFTTYEKIKTASFHTLS